MWRTHFLYDPAARWQHGLNQRCAQLASAAFIAGKDPGALVAYLAFWTNKEAKEKQSLDAWESVRRSDLYRFVYNADQCKWSHGLADCKAPN